MTERIETGCCVAGGGPAGMMLGLLLARAGIDVVVLEKHADFLRDFRGDTIHPSTMDVLAELGLLDAFLALDPDRVVRGGFAFPAETLWVPDFRLLDVRCPFVAMIPQWDFLDFIAEHARRYPGFTLRQSTEATRLIEEAGEIRGVRAEGPDGPLEVRARLVVAADGRHSTLREAAGLALRELGAPIDVLWLRVPREGDESMELLGRIGKGRLMIPINRGDYWQVAFVIEKGGFEGIRARGLDRFRADLAELAPFMAGQVGAIRDWDDVKLLTVRVDRLAQWSRPGFLAIGDAAHAMSPVGGVGINFAIQDAVATANLLWQALARGRPTQADLARVQSRRQRPVAIVQRLQVLAHERVILPALRGETPLRPPWLLRHLARLSWVRRQAARLIGIGPRPEHVESPDRARVRPSDPAM